MSARSLSILRLYSCFVAIVMVAPLIVVIMGAMTAGGYVTVPPSHWSFKWFHAALQDDGFRSAFKYSMETAAAVSIVATLIGVSCAVALRRYAFRGRGVIEAIVMAPLMIPHVIIAIGVVKLFSDRGWATAPWGLMAGQIVIVLPFVLRLTMAGVAGVNPLLESASRSLGATRLYTWRRVVLPLAAPSIVAALVFAFLLSLDEAVVSIFTSAPGKTTLPVQIFNYAEQRSDPLVAAVSAMLIILAVIVIVIVDRFFGLLGVLSGGRQRQGASVA
jgi:putative spermidine/putrescine transport system permease protein